MSTPILPPLHTALANALLPAGWSDELNKARNNGNPGGGTNIGGGLSTADQRRQNKGGYA